MKNLNLIIILLFSGIVNAQNNTNTFENAVGGDFGTLLEGLLVDGKIDETSAKNYLEAVFGYDEQVSSFLQTANFTGELGKLKQGNLSIDNYLSSINSSLISFVPQDKKQAYQQNLQKQMIYQSGVNDLFNGKINASVLQLAADVFQTLKEEKEAKLKREAIAKKLEAITPTLTRLNTNGKTYQKLKIVDEVDDIKNWVVNSKPSIRDDGRYRYTKNPTTLENGALKISTETQASFFSSEKMAFFELDNTYKNVEKFDFSKDFSMNLYFKMDKKDDQYVTMEIGNGYRLTIQRMHSFNGGMLIITTPLKYAVSDKYGVLTEKKDDSPKEKPIFDKEMGISIMQMGKSKKMLTIPEKYHNNGISFDENIKLTITKKGNLFSCKINDLPLEMTSEVNYFPNKYLLGFAVYSYVVTKKAYVEIQKLELEHL
ncbi:hypothetical protein J2Y38_004603 [Flavobacterium sp. 2755]|uniref:hypothetical protein n=1 Tax=Flavobacterium sp. 2755 TaxID=2817765 RepID=UPI0028639A24|nr:hypothetical protein [Flavobacterium sp. 2755]MDR6764370.1 hypothetical protein [Flavobacterium sp. 2755]